MSAISSQDIISILKEEIENYDFEAKDREIGHVIWVGDGIATVYGIDQAMYGEIVVFENGVKGMVQDVRRNEIGVILFGRDTGIKEGTKVTRTKKEKPEFRLEINLSEESSMHWEHRSMVRVTFRKMITGRLKMKHRVSLIVNLLAYQWRQESFLSIPCSRLAVDKES